VEEYEALLLGLNLAKDMRIKILRIEGNSDLAIMQVKNLFACKNDRLNRYRNVVWDTMELFDALSLEAVHRMFNGKGDALAMVALTLQLCEDLLEGERLKIIFRTPILENFEH
jgi:ribonuclease HI